MTTTRPTPPAQVIPIRRAVPVAEVPDVPDVAPPRRSLVNDFVMPRFTCMTPATRMATPTAAGMIAPRVGITLPTVAP